MKTLLMGLLLIGSVANASECTFLFHAGVGSLPPGGIERIEEGTGCKFVNEEYSSGAKWILTESDLYKKVVYRVNLLIANSENSDLILAQAPVWHSAYVPSLAKVFGIGFLYYGVGNVQKYYYQHFTGYSIQRNGFSYELHKKELNQNRQEVFGETLVMRAIELINQMEGK